MALKLTHKDVGFGVGDKVRVHQRIKEGEKNRESIFEGMVIAVSGRGANKTFTIRRVGEAGIGIEKIFPISLPSIEKVVVVKRGTEGVRRAKLYFTRHQSPTQIESIFKKAALKSSSRK